MLDPVQPLEYETGLFAYVFSVLHNLRGGPLEITGGRESKIFQWMNFFLDQFVCMYFFFDGTSFNVKGWQSFAQFNYITAR